MIFNSFEFIFLFLPIVLLIYFLLNQWSFTLAKAWLLAGSLFFYGWWNPSYLPLILASLVINFLVGTALGKEYFTDRKKWILTAGILFNVGLLGYFKYYDFFAENINFLFNESIPLKNLLLPLAISFYTFQQIGYLVDSYRGETKGYNVLDYCLFVTFFPQLIAGPIVHHRQVMEQFRQKENRRLNPQNFALGLLIFSMGLFKKVVIADSFAIWANRGYAMAEQLTFVDGWMTALSYTFQLYFDFSGYSDMAIGAGLLFNIHLPKNFFSPYKALDIQDFWRRWHITLNTFLTQYIYIPLGGSRKGTARTYINILIIFFISGVWHGAGWTFIAWGMMHGIASVIARAWKRAGYSMNKWLAWFITFNFVNLAWVFFRSPDFATALHVLKSMTGLNGIYLPKEVIEALHIPLGSPVLFNFSLGSSFAEVLLYIAGGLLIVLFAKNSIQWRDEFEPRKTVALYASVLFLYSVMQLQQVTAFLYFNF
ncbi:MBOAT family O-acyltransferase [Bacillus badius]|uniref:Poly(Beta-D-mannuronate) O-acetylase n=1 Tax=Bacillus badius TaxID=1455 RepID=A0ABR5AUT9_BACBA|nr:MBOAT family protein [Bacillus badius]KIL76372.1 putative poly(beta-D-mannuronate) O-acetylase [Bacillus badius]KIL78490.1 putative poly(beta-D-mannuronate) O-acetylase [Bacillus badius]MED4717450.1 MBOAT family protein [Bacillus badius]